MKELEAAIGEPSFWQSAKEKGREIADQKIKRLGELKNLIDRFDEVEQGIAELERVWNEDKFFEIKRKFRELELHELFKGTYDRGNAIVSVYPGAGGEDAEDWARMLFEMYAKHAAKRGWQALALDETPNRRLIELRGMYAYGYMKGEAGVHRLVRISPFSAKKLRHTSFALVEILPDLPEIEESKLQIPEHDLKWEFSRSSGPGGQNVNKVETAVRVVHIPTGLAASAQTERSQKSNREKALKVLKAKIFHLMEKNQIRELSELKVKVKPEWGSQIRSYVMNPYKLVKDHRTDVETADIDRVLDGDLDMFIEASVELLQQ